MLVRKIKCPTCGGYKLNEFTTAYIYCDYCGSLMGYDIEILKGESRQIFTPENMAKPAVQKFLKISQALNTAIQQKDAAAFTDAQLQMHETEFELYDKRFSPKIKQPSYRQKFLDFYKMFWQEKLDNDFFAENAAEQAMFKALSEKITLEYTNGVYKADFDTAFIEYLDLLKEHTKKSVDKTMAMHCMAYYPEGNTGISQEIFYKQALGAAILQYDEETISKSMEHLGLQSEFIETEAPETDEKNCVVCSSVLKIPEGAEHTLCETCGSMNTLKTGAIQCLACGADFNPADTDSCEYCGAKIRRVGQGPNKSEAGRNEEIPKNDKKGFWGKLFG